MPRPQRQYLDDGEAWVGQVAVWNQEKGFGFIEGDDRVDPNKIPQAKMNGGKVFFSIRDLIGIRQAWVGMRVEYSLYYDEKGLGAEKIKQHGEDGGYGGGGGGGGNMAMGNNNWNNGGYKAPQQDVDYEIPKGMAGVSEDAIRNMSEGEIMVRVRIPHHFVWQLIGKKGAVVKEMRQSTGAHFNFDDLPECTDDNMPNDAFTPPPSTDPRQGKKNRPDFSIVAVTGPPESVGSALMDMAARMGDIAESQKDKLTIVIPSVLCGRVIGKGGENIKKLKASDSGFKVDVSERFALETFEAELNLIVLFGVRESMEYAIQELVLILGEQWTSDMEKLEQQEQDHMWSGSYNTYNSNSGGGGGHGGMGGGAPQMRRPMPVDNWAGVPGNTGFGSGYGRY